MNIYFSITSRLHRRWRRQHSENATITPENVLANTLLRDKERLRKFQSFHEELCSFHSLLGTYTMQMKIFLPTFRRNVLSCRSKWPNFVQENPEVIEEVNVSNIYEALRKCRVLIGQNPCKRSMYVVIFILSVTKACTCTTVSHSENGQNTLL